MCIALHLCCRLHPVLRVSSRCPFHVPELPHVSVTSRRPTLVFGRLTLPVCREVVVCVVVLLCATRLSNLVSFGLRSLFPPVVRVGPKYLHFVSRKHPYCSLLLSPRPF